MKKKDEKGIDLEGLNIKSVVLAEDGYFYVETDEGIFRGREDGLVEEEEVEREEMDSFDRKRLTFCEIAERKHRLGDNIYLLEKYKRIKDAPPRCRYCKEYILD